MARRVTVVLADEQPLFRRGLRWALEQQPDLMVVGEAADGPTALALIERHAPAVALLHRELPKLSGLEIARQLAQRRTPTQVLLLSAAADERAQAQAAAVGAEAVAKSVEPEALAALVRRTGSGTVATGGRGPGRPESDEAAAAEEMPLSERELRILNLIAEGQSNREVASQLGVSEQTVKNAVSSILRKLAVNDRTQAVIAALRAGWISLA